MQIISIVFKYNPLIYKDLFSLLLCYLVETDCIHVSQRYNKHIYPYRTIVCLKGFYPAQPAHIGHGLSADGCSGMRVTGLPGQA